MRDLVFLGLGSMVGTGIFTITGIGAANYAGPALVVSILLSALAIGILALFYAEFASRIPQNGGAYSYVYATLGEFPAWLVGWCIILEFITAVSSVAVGWGSYLKGILQQYNICLPNFLNGSFNIEKGTYIDLLPMLVMVFVIFIVMRNAKTALRFNSLLVILKFSALALFIIVGIFHIKITNWIPFAPFGWGQLYAGKTGIFAGASIMFFAFLGFESISMTVDEVHNPQKTIPKSIILSLGITASLYIIVTLILTGIINYQHLNVSDAVSYALRQVDLTWAADYVSLVAILTLITVCISMTFAVSRTVFSISRDGLLPKILKKVSIKTKIPKNATLLVGSISLICAGLFPLDYLAQFVNISTMTYLIIMSIALIVLRKEKGSPETGQFKTPLVPILPILSIIICLSFMSQYNLKTWISFIIALLIGIMIYFLYGFQHSNLNEMTQKEIKK
ncbi:amino acid permease [Streptococcus urinalis 2285-97]|uniref:Amino acid permease n=2 Tax=Streptococcus urinalis TaxID=149016 RepID=G5KGA8_9STRE|nr:amino acid permease [Streptococcus urinalis 2285-97]